MLTVGEKEAVVGLKVSTVGENVGLSERREDGSLDGRVEGEKVGFTVVGCEVGA